MNKLIEWFQLELPEMLDDLNEPAKLDQISNLEEKLDLKFPTSFKDLYLQHNGQKGEINTGFFYGLEFLTLDGVYDHWKQWAEIVNTEDDEGMKDLSMFSKSHVNGLIKEVYANKKWIPFAHDWGGNFLGIDFDPAEDGTHGQIINFGRDEDEKFVVAHSFSEFIEWYINELENGNYDIVKEDDDGKSFNTRIPPSGHFLDAVSKIFNHNE